MSWSKKLAQIWLNYVPPSRPSHSELRIYTNYLREIQKSLKRKVELLVLGSTAEFKDWGFEEFLNVTVIDYSYDYYLEVNKGTKHKNIHETMVHKRWQDMDFENKFDIILGDLVVGNLKPHEVGDFFSRVSSALTKSGIFMTKSLFRNVKRIKSLEEIVKDYYKNYSHSHPFTKIMYDLNLVCMDHQQELLDFQKMYAIVHDGYKKGLLRNDTFDIFSKLGWQKEMNFKYYIPTIEEWENKITKYFRSFRKEYGEDIYSQNIPVYALFKS